MKPAREWIEEWSNDVTMPKDSIRVEVAIASIQSDARAELLAENRNLRRSLKARTRVEKCAHCGEMRHTVCQRDDMGGRVCLQCLERYLDDTLEAADL